MGHARRAGVAGAGGSCGGVWGRLPGGRLAQRAHHAHRRVLSAGRPPRARAARAAARVPRAAPSGAASAPAGCCAARRAGKQHRHGQGPAGPCWPCRAGAPRQWLQGPQGARRTRPHPAPAWPHERARLGAALQVPVGRAAVWRGAREVDGGGPRGETPGTRCAGWLLWTVQASPGAVRVPHPALPWPAQRQQARMPAAGVQPQQGGPCARACSATGGRCRVFTASVLRLAPGQGCAWRAAPH